MLCYVMLCYVMLCYVMLCYACMHACMHVYTYIYNIYIHMYTYVYIYMHTHTDWKWLKMARHVQAASKLGESIPTQALMGLPGAVCLILYHDLFQAGYCYGRFQSYNNVHRPSFWFSMIVNLSHGLLREIRGGAVLSAAALTQQTRISS